VQHCFPATESKEKQEKLLYSSVPLSADKIEFGNRMQRQPSEESVLQVL